MLCCSMQINVLFKMARDAQAVKQLDMVSASGVTQVALSRFESGKSTLSLDTLLKIAPILNISLSYLKGESSNPFHSQNLIKMFLPEGMSGPDFELIYLLAETNQRLDFIFLQLPPVFGNRLARLGFGGGPYTIAIAIRNDDNNYFLFRTKPRPIVNRAGDITGLQEMQTRIQEKATESDRTVSFSVLTLSEALHEIIQNWTVEKADIEGLFPIPDQEKKQNTREEENLLKLLRESKIPAVEIRKFICKSLDIAKELNVQPSKVVKAVEKIRGMKFKAGSSNIGLTTEETTILRDILKPKKKGD